VEGQYLYNCLVESAPSDPREIDGPSIHADGGLDWAVRVSRGGPVCRASQMKARGKRLFLPCALQRAYGNEPLCRAFWEDARQCSCLPCVDARQSNFSYLYLILKNYQTSLKNSRKLEQIKLCCLLLIENKFEVKTQFECQITYKSNHMLLTL
jgi:hypothetical protein